MGLSKQIFIDQRMIEIEQSIYFNLNNMNETKHTPDALKLRVIEAKKNLPKSVIPTFVHVFKEFNDEQSKTRLTNVLQLRVADKFITEKLEQLVEILKTNINE